MRPHRTDEQASPVWWATRHAHLMHAGIALFLFAISPVTSGSWQPWVLGITALLVGCLPLSSLRPAPGLLASLLLSWIGLVGAEPIALSALAVPWFICAMLLARGYPRRVTYLAAGAHALAFVAYAAFSPNGATIGLLVTTIIASPCLAGGETVRRHRHMITTSEQKRQERLEQQRRLVVSELHDTVVRDLSHAVMLAEQSRLAHPNDDLLQRELAVIIPPIRTAIKQLRRSLKTMSAAKGDDALLLLASSPPPRLSETIARSRASLADRGATLAEEGVELLDSPAITPGVHQQLVRVIGELITNAAKYASPSSAVSLVVETDGNTLECMCANAISPDAPISDALSSKIGLDGARRRIETLGGTFTVSRSAERWSVVFSVPIQVRTMP
ncbi:Signal transduction histidine kinase [Actinomyces denticolens]|uniref:Signal transduction histidine kinase n=2 Tax=Actinomycetaceae TaxID=2049 RepID=A0ABY1I5C6_9ACTO|nr:Signal transduction histidine kinase [Actinomyces denticolens]SUU09696.1 Signal transduction histidine kinase, nitrate /nitrite-specific [Actinomyces denticolens]